MNVQEMLTYLTLTVHAHSLYAKSAKKAVRLADQKTPYSVHPIWCAMTIACEHALPESLRVWGMQVLFFHDVLEDTNLALPTIIPEDVRVGIEAMTFPSSDVEHEQIWGCSPEIRLLKLYDKVSNLLDSTWATPERQRVYVTYAQELARDVKNNFGDLNIVRIANAIAI